MKMKKIFCAVLMIFAITFSVFGQNSGQMSGVIRDLSGDVQLKPSGAADFIPAKSGDTVEQNTIVSTGFKSNAIIAVGSSVITVQPLTRLSLAEIQTSSGTENLNVSLQTGRVRVDVKPPAGTKTNFTVQSPMATASVRGTSFDFDGQNVGTYEGAVAFGGLYGENVVVPAGESGSLGTDGTAGGNSVDILPPPLVGADDIVSQTAAKTSVSVEIHY